MPRKKATNDVSPEENTPHVFVLCALLVIVASIVLLYYPFPGSSAYQAVRNATHFNASSIAHQLSKGYIYAGSCLNTTWSWLSGFTGQNLTRKARDNLVTAVNATVITWESNDGLRHAVYSSIGGILLSLYSWHILYWDSYIPGTVPRSPPWPWKFRADYGHSLTLNQILALLIGPMAAVGIYKELHGSWYLG